MSRVDSERQLIVELVFERASFPRLEDALFLVQLGALLLARPIGTEDNAYGARSFVSGCSKSEQARVNSARFVRASTWDLPMLELSTKRRADLYPVRAHELKHHHNYKGCQIGMGGHPCICGADQREVVMSPIDSGTAFRPCALAGCSLLVILLIGVQKMRKSLSLLFLSLLATLAHGQTPMIYDDDGPVTDPAGTQNFGVFYKMVDHHWIKPLATIADSGDVLSAPEIHALAVYYRHTEIPIGAYQQNTRDSARYRALCKSPTWKCADRNAWVTRFDPVSGDTRANYQDCGALYRKTLAAQPDHSAVVVETGFATCLMRLLNSSADSYSPLAGNQLVKDKVKYLVIMGGDYPTGDGEWNFATDSSDYSALFSTWRSQNGYPPIYLVGFSLGMIACSGAPADAPIDKNPIRSLNRQSAPAAAVGKLDEFSGCVAGETGPVWDQLAIMYGAFGASHGGTTYLATSPGGTNTVDRSNGNNVWDASTNSGHYYLIAKSGPQAFAAFLDGYSHKGLLAEPPASR